MGFLPSLTRRKIRSFTIRPDAIDNFIGNVESEHLGVNWPVVYLLHSENYKDYSGAVQKLLYIGESTSAARRMSEHFSHTNKNYGERIKLNQAHIIFDETFNKSAILDIEQELIHMFGADSSNYVLQNRNDGQSTQHQYYSRDEYISSLREIWDELRAPQIGLASDSFEDVRNSNLFKYSPYTSLTVEQNDVCNRILDQLIDSLHNKKKFNAIIEGNAGTGKTVVLIKVLSELVHLSRRSANPTNGNQDSVGFDDDANGEDWDEKQAIKEARIKKIREACPDGLRVAYVVPLSELQKPFQKVIKAVCGDADIVKTATEVASDPKRYDVIFVDEGHRLGTINKFGTNKDPYKRACESLGLTYTKGMANPPTELDWLVNKSNNCVYVYDKNQKVRSHNSISHSVFESLVLSRSYTSIFRLSTQMRCKAGDRYVKFINDLFDNNLKGSTSLPPWKGYDFRIYDDVDRMLTDINAYNANGECGLSRVVAGYGWKWNTKGKKREQIKNLEKSDWDIHIGGHDYFWNEQNGNFIFNADRDEIGCVHTVQGFDLNYVGVIFGPEIDYNPETGFIVNKNYAFDSGTKTKDKKELLDLTIRAYKVMMERGIKGCYVYAYNPSLQKYLKEHIPSVSSALDSLDMTVTGYINKLTGISVSSGGKKISDEILLKKVDVDNMIKDQGDVSMINTIKIDGADFYVTRIVISDDDEYYRFSISKEIAY